MKLIKILCVLFIVCGALPYVCASDAKARRENQITRTKFDEIWPIIVTSFWKPIKNTKKEKELCWKKILRKDISLCLNDPNAEYMSGARAKQMKQWQTGIFEGIGIIIKTDQKRIFIEDIINGLPAEISRQFQDDDELIEINGVFVSRMTEDSILQALYAPKETPVTLRVKRNGVARDPIELKSARLIVYSVFMQEMDSGIVYLWITEFNKNTPSELRALLNYTRIEKILFSVRGNPGGLLDSVGKICAFFADSPDSIVITLKSRAGEKIFRASDFEKDYLGIFKHYKNKVVVLMDGGSASSSEIFANCMREELEAPLVGRRSYGKGTVQTTIALHDDDLLTLTTEEYFLGKNKIRINKIGIMPDYPVQLSDFYENPEIDIPLLEGLIILLNR